MNNVELGSTQMSWAIRTTCLRGHEGRNDIPRTISSVTGSRMTAAVKPTPLEPLPVVYTPLGATFVIYFNNCDFATPGSPIKQTLISPLIFIPSPTVLLTPPTSNNNSAFFTSSCP